jgi:DNA-binding CsgD family transcriptional regulator
MHLRGYLPMQPLTLTDVERIVRLVSEAGDPTVDVAVPERKRMLLEGLARLVEADIWCWSTAVFNPDIPGDAASIKMVDGGWIDGQERGRFIRSLNDPDLRATQVSLLDVVRARHLTVDRGHFPQRVEQRSMDAAWRAAGIGQYLVSFYPLGDTANSVVGFYRRQETPLFTDRDRTIVHVVVSQVGWLHCHGLDVPAKVTVLQLSRREREVMSFLLIGDSQKQVARKLELSEHTVGDYVKQIYKHFEVNSRAELLAHFIAGGQR